jgi:tetratricopeptide (TPR) repeat protein
MKFILVFVLISFTLSQGTKGKVSFLLGKATYQVEGTKKWKSIKLDDNVFQNWTVKTSSGAELEISWENGTTSEISSDNTIALKSLLKDIKIKTSWFDRMKSKLQILFAESTHSKIKDVAGIRQSEVNISKKDSLYWETLPKTDFNEAYALYINNEWNNAARLFEEVIEQNPLNKSAEISRSCLIIIYSEQGNKLKATEHLSNFISDFPESDLKSLVEEAKIGL